jgi:phosphocarrier protein HPr
MKEIQAQVLHAEGLHARPAARFVAAAQRCRCEVTIIAGERKANAKSMLAVLSLGIGSGQWLTVQTHGPDEAEAIARLAALLAETSDHG